MHAVAGPATPTASQGAERKKGFVSFRRLGTSRARTGVKKRRGGSGGSRRRRTNLLKGRLRHNDADPISVGAVPHISGPPLEMAQR